MFQAKYEDIKKVVKAASEGPMKGVLGYTEHQVGTCSTIELQGSNSGDVLFIIVLIRHADYKTALALKTTSPKTGGVLTMKTKGSRQGKFNKLQLVSHFLLLIQSI